MAGPDDSLMDMVDNIEGMYTTKIRMFDRWVEEGDSWSEATARRQALALAKEFASELEESDMVTGKYRLEDYRKATSEMMEQFEEHRDYAIKEAVERSRKQVPSPAMDAGAVEHAQKYEALAQLLGVDFLRKLIPASPERVRKALETGDQHLNTIPIYKWDDAGLSIQKPGLSMAEKVCVLKHVAKWHYA
jgi:hypothetical protein